MAEQCQQNVVEQPQSVDALPSIGASVTKPIESAARAALETLQATPEDSSTTTQSVTQNKQNNENDGTISTGGREISKPPVVETRISPNVEANVPVDGIQETSILEDGPNSTGVDGSSAPDTENSKSEAIETVAKDADGQGPRYAVRKSASFKPVSVTKNFLAKAGSTSTPLKTSADKASAALVSSPGPSSSLTALRPRLVAKSASGQRDTILKSASMQDKNGSSSTPDPNQVWNRNRVSTPQATGATPKHLTDEELRQQYGIQLASRPQEDGDDKGAKWADIDDEEDDDWVPETIEWNDGTKINLAEEAERAAAAAAAAAAAEAQAEKERAEERARKAAALKAGALATKTTTVGPNATVLKLSSHQKSPSLSLKGGEKPTLVAKPSSLAVKSPWASLPAMDKASPVLVNPTTQLGAPRFDQRNAHGFDAIPPSSQSQAKEIAADDFSRLPRETPNGTQRELFVPQSGRYEPVSESRRQSGRKDSSIRPPSLLQRPSHTDQQGPAQPSAAFQTSRAQQESGPTWSRRRASSTLSGESGRFARRQSFGKGLESLRGVGESTSRRNSQFDQSPFIPGAPSARGSQRDASPAQSHGVSITSQSPSTACAPDLTAGGSSAVQLQTEQVPPVETPNAGPQEDAVALQKRLMKEKREAAIKRKKEEEEREEAEKRERIRIKMEKLGAPPDKPLKKDRPESTGPSQKVSATDPKDVKVSLDATPQSPPKPPVPNASGQPQQYGMMKVHGSQSIGASPSIPKAAIDNSLLDITPGVDVKQPRFPDAQVPLINGQPKENRGDTISMPQNDPRSRDPTIEPRPWSNAQQAPNNFPNWANTGMTTHSTPGGNLWGPPSSHNRALGNGDFQNNLQRGPLRTAQPPFTSQPAHTQHFSSQTPQPIGTPRQTQQQPRALQSLHNDLSRSSIEDSQTIPAYPSSEPEHLSKTGQLRPDQTAIFRTVSESHPQPTPALLSSMPHTAIHEHPKTGPAAWVAFSTNTERDEKKIAQLAQQEHAARLAEQQLHGVVPPVQIPIVNQTWKQVKRGDAHGTRQIVNQVKSEDIYSSRQPVSTDMQKVNNTTPTAPHGRSRYSDFFEQDQRAVSLPSAIPRPGSPSAPPPDSVDHPAYIGISQRPLVNLPGAKPKLADKPVVKLPPPKDLPTASGTQMVIDSRADASGARPSSLVSSPSWQARFNGLFSGRKDFSPESHFAQIVDFSASKEPLELPLAGATPTAVILPPFEESWGKSDLLLKSVEEEDALFEERDFGSVPVTRIPPRAPSAAWTPAKEPMYQYKRSKQLALKDADIVSVLQAPLAHNDTHRNGTSASVSIYLPGMPAATSKTIHRNPSTSASTRGGKSHASRGKFRPGPKSREPSASHGPSKSPQPNATNRSLAQASNTSKAKVPPPHKANTTWAHRASAVA